MLKMRFSATIHSKTLWILFTTALFIQYSISESDFTEQCNICSCLCVSGRRTANCSNKSLNHIPKDLSILLREIDFSNNPLYSLSYGEFISANLVNVQKLKFQNCLIEMLNEGAFQRLALMTELDLCKNAIVRLHKNTFTDNIKLRILILSYNKIEFIEDGLFSNLSYIQRIDIDHNEIEYINENTFLHLPSLTDISLGYNKLKTVEFDMKHKLPKLNNLNVAENPWMCDCHLEQFHQSIIRSNLITHVTKCDQPPRMKGKLLSAKDIFACSPIIINPLPLSEITAASNTITLYCKVSGEPEPDVKWTNKGHVLKRDPRKNKQKYLIAKGKTGGYTWNNLTIINLSYEDRGEYRCIAKNPGGEDAQNIILITGGSVSASNNLTVLIIWFSVALNILLVIILILAYVACKKANNKTLHPAVTELVDSLEDCDNMIGHWEVKREVSTHVNLIGKPPEASAPAWIVSCGTEVSDAKGNPWYDDAIVACDEKSKSIDFDQSLLRESSKALPELEYMPDLLTLAPRTQISPAGSNASMIITDSRLSPHYGPQSPVQSPIYDQLNMCGTLPSSRSHSPLAHNVGDVRIPKQGFGNITMPRRPKNLELLPISEVIDEPPSDNVGVLSTATEKVEKVPPRPPPKPKKRKLSGPLFELEGEDV